MYKLVQESCCISIFFFIIESDFSGGNPGNLVSSGATLMQRKLAIGQFGSRDYRAKKSPSFSSRNGYFWTFQ
ncbi:hypothetical protein WN51_05895 [Melipona quadrifasciata]|uniref:Uncharacterized protein n=1 Tax=Melipona quadrifasciata TaxID=166423 RepID=A0A0M9A641_9HYME|nr:hypothetical protein WN51_05895 [Melipona quadrifasciata]